MKNYILLLTMLFINPGCDHSPTEEAQPANPSLCVERGNFEPEAEHIASNESMTHLLGVMNCIMCGACVSECTALEVDPTFTGPAALAKAYRFVADPRDEEKKSRLGKLNENSGVWDCTRCLACVEVCPKDVAPMERIVKMRDLAIEEGYTNTSGFRHTESFNDSIKKHGR